MWPLSHVTVWPGRGGAVACFVVVVLSGTCHPIHWATGEWLELPSPLWHSWPAWQVFKYHNRQSLSHLKLTDLRMPLKRNECVNWGINRTNILWYDDHAMEYHRFLVYLLKTWHFQRQHYTLQLINSVLNNGLQWSFKIITCHVVWDDDNKILAEFYNTLW